MKILVIDGQGGGLGRQLVSTLKVALPESEIIAVGTNALATSAMLKAGAEHAATGENAVVVNCRKADIIVGIWHRHCGFHVWRDYANDGSCYWTKFRKARFCSRESLRQLYCWRSCTVDVQIGGKHCVSGAIHCSVTSLQT